MSRLLEEMKTDTKAGISYWTVVNGLIDHYAGGINGIGLVISRSIGAAFGVSLSGISGQWRDYIYKKSYPGFDREGLKRYSINASKDLFSGYTFMPFYVVVLYAGTHITYGHADWDKIWNGVETSICFSTLTTPLYGLYLNAFRRMYSLQTAEDKASGKSIPENETEVKKNDINKYVEDLHQIIQW